MASVAYNDVNGAFCCRQGRALSHKQCQRVIIGLFPLSNNGDDKTKNYRTKQTAANLLMLNLFFSFFFSFFLSFFFFLNQQ
jgi:hypothetical protein